MKKIENKIILPKLYYIYHYSNEEKEDVWLMSMKLQPGHHTILQYNKNKSP